MSAAAKAGNVAVDPVLPPPPWLAGLLGGADGRGVAVGLVDSGCDPAWKDPRIRPEVGLAPGAAGDRIGHGTACADILLGMAPGVTVQPIRIFDRRLQTSVAILVAALHHALESGVRVVNLSLGTRLRSALVPLYAVCEDLRRQGVILVAAGVGTSFPAVFENSLGVRAGRFANVFDFEYRGGSAVECTAQGRRRVRALGGGLTGVEASSFAAPHVTALVARLLERHPDADLDRVRQLLAELATRRAAEIGTRRPPPSCRVAGSDR